MPTPKKTATKKTAWKPWCGFAIVIDANEVKAAFAIVLAVTETIREAGEVPEGILYASLMDRVDLGGFEKMMQLVVNTGLVTRANHLLRWVGPTLPKN